MVLDMILLIKYKLFIIEYNIIYNINKKKMVKICDINNYPSENEEKYKEHFDKFKYPLHIFQKYARAF